MNGIRHQTPFGTRLAAALAAGAFGALAISAPAMAQPDPGAGPGVDVGQAKHGNMPALIDSESGTLTTTSDDGGIAYVQIGLGALGGAALAAGAVVVMGSRRQASPRPA